MILISCEQISFTLKKLWATFENKREENKSVSTGKAVKKGATSPAIFSYTPPYTLIPGFLGSVSQLLFPL